ncbi:SDR family NAD(P)-dependent oxidoreductase [Saccharothrix yanglingensis]|uniref:Erythronolide synthase n=1 Tax=Saccharothrix yanglingensis TaxID=659496 RepID=A0ABU0X528_9PSEU|nr:SDR family NAD(P)-dependent oxidoreductase [Saccharothrix yanglingensis]MDQ2586818.1 erythronolide synthase [Saccharothrix yanglingensis]
MSTERIAIVGIGLRYPDASSTQDLWENVLAGRRAFRRLPDQRMNQADYYSPDRSAPDRFYSTKAAVLRDFEFDRLKYKVAGSTYRSTDLTHWLALDVAANALADAGFPNAEGLPRQATGVVLGNSLTGEFSRANLMRLRWPYVRRTLAAALSAKGWDDDETAAFLRDLEPAYKAPFPAIDEDTLAGGLANTIAGRICNYFDLRGGGFTVDGACSSSLLSITTAAKALSDGDLDVCLAGGVDLSIDPFEVIGFAKTGALATGEMKVYDADSNGFWPGEGSGVLVLMREEDAIARGSRIYASIAGWGMSSDGKGGITRPEVAGHRLAISRAYGRAGYGVETVAYFEGHGTGTALGDATELEAIGSARRESDPDARPAAISSLKANIGHTKAAAGVAGVIKAALAVHHQVIPPGTGNYEPHPKLTGDSPALYVPREPELWPADQPIRAGVSAMGFGGINTHIALEQAPGTTRRAELRSGTAELTGSRQDAELLLFDAADHAELRERLTGLVDVVAKLSFAELGDLAAELSGRLAGGPVRAAVVTGSPEDAVGKIARLVAAIAAGETRLATADGVYLAEGTTAPKIAYLFPGQGSGRGAVGAIRRRFAEAEAVFAAAGLPSGGDQVATEVAQPRIVAGSLAALRVLRGLGVDADVAVGHSLGELTALSWAGALSDEDVLRLAKARGEVMANASRGGGAMAGLATTPERALELSADEPVVIAGYNGPKQTVIAGDEAAVGRVCDRARAAGVTANRINVSHAFHSPLVEPASRALTSRLTEFAFAEPTRAVASTVTGDLLEPGTDLRELLRDQVLFPVRFHEAAAKAAGDADLAVEVGPGRVLAGLLRDIAPGTPVLSVDTDNTSLTSLLSVVGAAFALGAAVDTGALFAGRVIRPLPLDGGFTFLTNPCETAPDLAVELGEPGTSTTGQGSAASGQAAGEGATGGDGPSTLDLLRELAAERVELPLETVAATTHPLDDLHLSSITVGQLVNDVTSRLGLPTLEATTSFATVTLGELADLIDELAESAQGGNTGRDNEVAGVGQWVRPFSVDYVPARAPRVEVGTGPAGTWRAFAPAGHPLAERLRVALDEAGIGDGVLLCLPDSGEEHVGLMLAAGQAATAAPPGTRFVVVQHRYGASGLARTAFLEADGLATTIVSLPDLAPKTAAEIDEAVRKVVVEAAATTTFSEVRYDADGRRTAPVLTVLQSPAEPRTGTPLDSSDVLLVTGGAKGITAECALVMAVDSGAKLALIGRDAPADDEEISANLARMAAAGVACRYERADVTDPEQVAAAVARFEAALGPITGVMHGAGRNEPAALGNLTEERFRQTLAVKITGLRSVLDAVDQDRIKLLVTFGSIIGRAGLRGEAHYSTANDWMSELTVDFQRAHPGARALAMEWSVWSGAGMGERLGVVEALARDGITPVSVEEGLRVLRQVLADASAGPVVTITGRLGGLATLPLDTSKELPLSRFVDRVLLHYPDVELVTEVELSAGSDPYLSDHALDGDLLFPAVVGMEAMAQVATAVLGRTGTPLLQDVEFLRPIVVRPGSTTTVRLAALVRDTETVTVAIRAKDTGFSADHFRATLRFPRPAPPDQGTTRAVTQLPPVPLDPITELYGGVMFQGKRFQRVLGYRRASARHAVADLSTTSPAPWFAAYLPQEQVLADPGTRDAVMHALQCCVPDATLLPQGVDRLYLAEPSEQQVEYVVLDAHERSQDGDSYVYDIDVLEPSGRVVERWEGLMLRAVRQKDSSGPWVPAMLSGYLERALERVLGGGRAVVVEPDPRTGEPADRRTQTRLAASRALGRSVEVRYRPDGKPEVDGASISASHGAGVSLVVTGPGTLGCDVEAATPRNDWDWVSLLGKNLFRVRDLVVAESGEDPSTAGTRLWSALECLRKTGTTTRDLVVDRITPDGWVVFSTGDVRVATWATTLNDLSDPVVFAVLSEGR